MLLPLRCGADALATVRLFDRQRQDIGVLLVHRGVLLKLRVRQLLKDRGDLVYVEHDYPLSHPCNGKLGKTCGSGNRPTLRTRQAVQRKARTTNLREWRRAGLARRLRP